MRALLHTVFAHTATLAGRCQVCGRWPATPVCETCLWLHATPAHRCGTCAIALTGPQAHCGACLTGTPSLVSTCLAALDYGYPWDRLIARWKFQGDTGWSPLWAQLMWRDPALQALWQGCDAVVPVPVSPARLAQRGYNQAWELVKALHRRARTTEAPGARPLSSALMRTRETPDQHSLTRAERLRNLRGAMLVHPLARPRLGGRHVLLVDDVSTTGATLEVAAEALRDAGAARVSACVLARTPPPA